MFYYYSNYCGLSRLDYKTVHITPFPSPALLEQNVRPGHKAAFSLDKLRDGLIDQ